MQSSETKTWISLRPKDEYGDVGAYFSTKANVDHIWGVQYVLSTWTAGPDFFWQTKKARLNNRNPSLFFECQSINQHIDNAPCLHLIVWRRRDALAGLAQR